MILSVVGEALLLLFFARVLILGSFTILDWACAILGLCALAAAFWLWRVRYRRR